jgi:hypothetical protein
MVLIYHAYEETIEKQKKKDNLLKQMHHQQSCYNTRIDTSSKRDKRKKRNYEED